MSSQYKLRGNFCRSIILSNKLLIIFLWSNNRTTYHFSWYHVFILINLYICIRGDTYRWDNTYLIGNTGQLYRSVTARVADSDHNNPLVLIAVRLLIGVSVHYLSLKPVLVIKWWHLWLHVMTSANHHTVKHLFHQFVIVEVFGGDLPFAGLFVVTVGLKFDDSVPKADIIFVQKLFSI